MIRRNISIFLVLYVIGVIARSAYKVCVPKLFIKDCKQMIGEETRSKAAMECVTARDRMQCLDFIQERKADFTAVDVEDVYIASKIADEEFVIFQEFRTYEESNEDFRYEAVMVVPVESRLTSLEQLKGGKSCHTGIDRNAGYKIPLTMLAKISNFPSMTDNTKSLKENELRALSNFFTGSCIVGTWSSDLKANSVWKIEYSTLCSLCENSRKCDYPDKYSGYEGALRCLLDREAQVAFTKAKYVRKFFGIHKKANMLEETQDYSYFCPDGQLVPLINQPCSWVARPWPGLLGHKDVTIKMNALREKIKQLSRIGDDDKKRPKWYERVLGLTEKIHEVTDVFPIKPSELLLKANFTDVIERSHGSQEFIVKLCVTSYPSLVKCRALSLFAYSRGIRPKLECIQEAHETECLKSVQDNGSDLAAVDGMRVVSVLKKYNLHPVMHEVYGRQKTPRYAVAVVKKHKPFSATQLKGKRTCHAPHGSFSGLKAPLYYLIKNKIISSGQCVKLMGEFFGGSCLPDVDKDKKLKGLTSGHLSKLLRLCTKDHNPLKCLEHNRGDIAFVSSDEITKLSSSIYELLCLNRESEDRASLSKYASCHITMIPPRIWMSSKDYISDVPVSYTMLNVASILDSNQHLFDIHADYMNNKDVIFLQNATGLESADLLDMEELESFNYIMNSCGIE